MSEYKKKRKIYNVAYEVVDPLLPEMQKKVDLAFDILFDAILRDRTESRFIQSPDSTDTAGRE